MGVEQSRRDDLESISYVTNYFLRGSLPWQGLNAKNKNEKYRKIMETKMSTPIETLCKNQPSKFCFLTFFHSFLAEMANFVNYCRGLRFEEDPSYDFLKKNLKSLFEKNGFEYDYAFDWTNNSFVKQ